jgi:ethanolamine utilization microcompartment shell protein EutS
MKKIILALLMGFTITATTAQTYTTLAQLTAKVKADSITQAKRIAALELKVQQQATAIGTLQMQTTANAGSIKDLNAGRLPIDFNYFDTTGGALKTKPVDFTAVNTAIKAVSDRVDKIPIIDTNKLQALFDWWALAKTVFITITK